MPTFKEILKEDLSEVILNSDEFAEASTYTPKGGAPASISAMWDYVSSATDDPAQGQEQSDSAEILVSAEDVPSPARGDVIANESGVEYLVTGSGPSDGISRLLRASRKSRLTFGTLNFAGVK